MYSSKRNSPCPVCSRTKDQDCRWDTDVVLCHRGSSHGPPENLRIGDKVQIDGSPWALVAVDGGFDRQAFVFKPHQERNHKPANSNWRDKKQEQFDLSVKITCARIAADQFLEIARKALDVLEFESAPPDELKESLALIYESERQGLASQRELQSLIREDKELRPVFEQVNSTLKELTYQRKDADLFRKNFLGEVLP